MTVYSTPASGQCEPSRSTLAAEQAIAGQPLQLLGVPGGDDVLLLRRLKVEEVSVELADRPFPAPPVLPVAVADQLRAVDGRAEAGDVGQLEAQGDADVDGGGEDDRPELPLAGPVEAGADVAGEGG